MKVGDRGCDGSGWVTHVWDPILRAREAGVRCGKLRAEHMLLKDFKNLLHFFASLCTFPLYGDSPPPLLFHSIRLDLSHHTTWTIQTTSTLLLLSNHHLPQSSSRSDLTTESFHFIHSEPSLPLCFSFQTILTFRTFCIILYVLYVHNLKL